MMNPTELTHKPDCTRDDDCRCDWRAEEACTRRTEPQPEQTALAQEVFARLIGVDRYNATVYRQQLRSQAGMKQREVSE